MFRKKKCPNCEEKISKKHKFCPNCGKRISKNDEDWGMLGKNDSVHEENQFQSSLFEDSGFGILNKFLGTAMKMLEKEIQKEMNQKNIQPKTKFELFINGKKINPNNIKFSEGRVRQIPKDQIPLPLKKKIDEYNLRRFSKLPREEAPAEVRRLSDKVIYEIEIPEVKSLKDVYVQQLENSIEVKALGKNKSYFKLIPISFPLRSYNLRNGKLILELDAKQ